MHLRKLSSQCYIASIYQLSMAFSDNFRAPSPDEAPNTVTVTRADPQCFQVKGTQGEDQSVSDHVT